MPSTPCTTCGKPVPSAKSDRPRWYPFCSQRCKLIDLGKWFNEEYRVSDPIKPSETIEDLPDGEARSSNESPDDTSCG